MNKLKKLLTTLLVATIIFSCAKDDSLLSTQERAENRDMHDGYTHLATSASTNASILYDPYTPIIPLIDHAIYAVLEPILPDKFSSEEIDLLEQAYIWTYQEDGNIVYTIDFEYLEGSIKKVLIHTDSDNTIKSINILEVFIGSLNNSVSVHNVVVDSVIIYPVDSDRSAKGNGSRNSTADCIHIVFGNNPGGTGTFNPSNTGTDTSGPIGGTDSTGGGVDYPFSINCGCNPAHSGGSSNPQCNCTMPDIVTIRKGINTIKGTSKESDSRYDQEYWDCIEDLIGCQILNDYDLAITTLKHCQGVFDVNDVDNHAGNDGTNQFIGPEFCDDWKNYQTQCLNGSTSMEGVYQPWAGFMINNPDLFFDAIEGLPECISTDEMEDIICVENAYIAFISEYKLIPTSEEEEAIKKIPCGEKFNDLATDFLMEKCLGAFYIVLEQLENFTNQEKLEYCNSELPEIIVGPPGCEGCSVGEAQVVWGDEIKALNMLDCAIEKLDEFNGSTPDDVKQALIEHFGGTSSTFVANYIKFLFEHVRRYPYDREYQADDDCDPGVVAWTYPTVHFTDVRLCRPLYWQVTDIERAGTLIHEWMHLYYFAGDIAYEFDPDYPQLNTLQQLFNADAFSEFVKEICNE